MQHKPGMSIKRKLLLLLILWTTLALAIGLVSYRFYPSWLVATPLLAIVAAAAALTVLDQLDGALNLINQLFFRAGAHQDNSGTKNNNSSKHKGQVFSTESNNMGKGVYPNDSSFAHNPLLSSKQIPQQLASLVFELREKMAEVYSLDEVRLLCTPLGIDYDELDGTTKSLKIESLVTFMGRRDRLDELIAWLRQDRPRVDWPEMPSRTKEFEDFPPDEYALLARDSQKLPLTRDAISTIGQQARLLEESLLLFQERLSIRPEIIPAFNELYAEIKEITKQIENYAQENPSHSLKRVIENNIGSVRNESETVQHELRQALLRTNQEPFNDYTREPKEALIRLRKHWSNFVINLEKVSDLPTKE